MRDIHPISCIHDDYGEFLEIATRPVPSWSLGQASRSGGRMESWDWGVEWDECVGLARLGWPDGTDKMLKVSEAIYNKIRPPHGPWPVLVNDLSGACVDVGAYISGDPECMLRFANARMRPPQPVTLIVSCCFSASITAEQITNRGAAVLAIIDALQAHGCNITLYLEESLGSGYGGDGKHIAIVDILVKRAGDVFDVDRLAYSVMHPTFLRRLMFGYEEQWPADVQELFAIGAGYGHVAESPPEHRVQFGPHIYFGAMFGGYGDHGDGETWDSMESATAKALEVVEGYLERPQDEEVVYVQ